MFNSVKKHKNKKKPTKKEVNKMQLTQYLKDMWSIITLDENAYKKIGNDKDALKRYIGYFIAVNYIAVLILALVATGFIILLGIVKEEMPWEIIALIGVGVILFLPWINLLFDIFGAFLNHVLALIFKGKAKSFWDFYKVYRYPRPVMRAISIIPFVSIAAQFYYIIWDFCVLYKTLRIIHMMEKGNAAWVLGIKIFFYVIMLAIVLGVYIRLITGAYFSGLVD